MKILIAEDDRLSRAFLKKAMEKYGACDVAVDGMEALDLYLESMCFSSHCYMVRF